MTLALARPTISTLATRQSPAQRWRSCTPPVQIKPGVMVQRWSDLALVSWDYDPAEIAALLPEGIEPDLAEGRAWISLVPFRLDLRATGTPRLPWAGRFQEANVRTYVIGPDGLPGIWFLSLDAERLGAAMIARQWYQLPYVWADMHTIRNGQRVYYTSRRRWPVDPVASFDLEIEHGRPRPVREHAHLTQFLTCRWRLYSPTRLQLPPARMGTKVTVVDHPEWQIADARILALHSTMLEAAGLSAPSGDPLAHYSPGVRARFAARVPC